MLYIYIIYIQYTIRRTALSITRVDAAQKLPSLKLEKLQQSGVVAVQETGISRHHRGLIEGSLKPLGQYKTVISRGLSVSLNILGSYYSERRKI